jgi:hypothetical protein
MLGTHKNGRQGRPSVNKLSWGDRGLFNHTVGGIPLASFANLLTKVNKLT